MRAPLLLLLLLLSAVLLQTPLLSLLATFRLLGYQVTCSPVPTPKHGA
jgi:hypothetical protein